eukprot:TRINITY_DN14981_c0_g2_i1.p1 TRINITY_DN14981_c0_g2~~TRINITY_DN14981_c0_g2_i1.p1  ORF type:complete len:728 (-),score=101.51 TRINITY_DN14981_c0_g2_i1:65-2161(-)
MGKFFSKETKVDSQRRALCKGAIVGLAGVRDVEDQILDVFMSWDKNGDGKLSLDELMSILTALDLEVSESDVRKLVQEEDPSDKRGIDFHMFVRWLFQAPNLRLYFDAIRDIQYRMAGRLKAEKNPTEAIVARIRLDAKCEADKILPPLIEKTFDWHDKMNDNKLDRGESILFFTNYVELLIDHMHSLEFCSQVSLDFSPESFELVGGILEVLICRKRDAFYENMDARHKAGFAVVDVNKDGEIQKSELLQALLPGSQKHNELMNALDLLVTADDVKTEMAKLSPLGAKVLYVVVPISNPVGFNARKTHFLRCVKELGRTRARLADVLTNGDSAAVQLRIILSELAYDDEPFASDEIDESVGVTSVHKRRVSRDDAMWSKENLINIAFQRLPPDAKYIAWLDGDILFDSDDWVARTVMALDGQSTGGFVQLFEEADLLGPEEEVLWTTTGFAKQSCMGKEMTTVKNTDRDYWHPGFAWASTREVLKNINGLPERTLGGADRHIAMALLGRVAETVPDGIHAAYRNHILDMECIMSSSGYGLSYTEGSRIRHLWHGSYSNRLYCDRWKILKRSQFNPAVDMQKRTDDVLVWSRRAPAKLRRHVYKYFKQRDEDSMTLEPSSEQGGIERVFSEESSNEDTDVQKCTGDEAGDVQNYEGDEAGNEANCATEEAGEERECESQEQSVNHALSRELSALCGYA